eukprot:CAMPEP_0194269624 /NCGR_PEP_ID=MMETSP0169-20130528/3766_1 /TAXON_ID=218684 /ORGANISM="Corethron pennatum, Strain L29A3" /LENGTH=213 /DNA_ID=CAMNT_0039011349 /DNA_START=137 /DNA_END=775 /DNA_ORIENTATION=+
MVRPQLPPPDTRFDLTAAVFSGDDTNNPAVHDHVSEEKRPPTERARSPCYESRMAHTPKVLSRRDARRLRGMEEQQPSPPPPPHQERDPCEPHQEYHRHRSDSAREKIYDRHLRSAAAVPEASLDILGALISETRAAVDAAVEAAVATPAYVPPIVADSVPPLAADAFVPYYTARGAGRLTRTFTRDFSPSACLRTKADAESHRITRDFSPSA